MLPKRRPIRTSMVFKTKKFSLREKKYFQNEFFFFFFFLL